MARPKNYSRDVALQTITELFWRKGYHATSLSDLERVTGVGRKSLQNDFGSKEEMFALSLDHYLDIKAKPDGAALAQAPPSPENIRRFFRAIRYREGDEWGCLLALTILERESAPPKAGELARKVYLGLEEAFLANLMPAVTDGRLASRSEAKKLAAFFLNTLHGIVINGRAGRSNSDLKKVVEVALSVLPPEPHSEKT
jgi:TetR/AcrR family transcriptional repressor of nem operon